MKTVYAVSSTDEYDTFNVIAVFELEKDARKFVSECQKYQDARPCVCSGEYDVWCNDHPAGDCRNDVYYTIELPYMEAK